MTKQTERYDIAIVGNGILAMATALEVARRELNCRIVIVGPERRLDSASLASGAMLGVYGELTEMTLTNPFGRRKFEFAKMAHQKWGEWLSAINENSAAEDQATIQPGTYVILNTRSTALDDRNYQIILAALEHDGVKHAVVNPSDVPGLNPIADYRSTNAVYIDDNGTIDSHSLIKATQRQCQQQHNISFIDATVSTIYCSDSSIKSLLLDNGGQVEADKICLSAGAKTQTLIEQCHDLKNRIPMLLHSIGVCMLFNEVKTPLAHCIRTPNRSNACGLHMLPRNDGKVYLGATNSVYFNELKSPPSHHVHFLLECALRQISQDYYTAGVEGLRVGSRPFSIDGFPLIGPTSLDNTFILAGGHRDGLTIAPVYAEMMASYLLTGDCDHDNPFIPERDHIQVLSREKAIETATEHMVATCYEYGMYLPNIGIDPYLQESLHRDFTQIYQLFADFDVVLPPEIVLLFKNDYDLALKTLTQYFKERENINVV